jgi:hypothetical protein
MPRLRSRNSPAIAVPNKMAAAIAQARTATCWRACCGRPAVNPAKTGTRPMGSTTTSKVTKAETT